VRLDPALFLVEDRADGEIALEGLEGFLDRDELLPEQRRILLGDVGAQQVASLAPAQRASKIVISDLSTAQSAKTG